jgi:hypothetical protein
MPAGLSAGIAKSCVPWANRALVKTMVFLPAVIVIPTREIFETVKYTSVGWLTATCVVSSSSSGGVLRSAWKAAAVVQ